MVNNFKKIMVCLDGSKHSEKALSQAIQIAKKFESKIILVHVIEPTAVFNTMQNPAVPYWGSISAPLLQSSLNQEQEEGNKILAKNSHILEKEGISFDIVLLLGNPSEEILNFSKKKKVDFIVVGSLGKGMLSRVLLGSVSTSISQRADCTVIIVR
ncbi:MAG: universal stress protein [Nitrosopumilus sp.]|nr:universal stress protein [Nitrosopumilus sp.]